jgi:hypothetical protein
MRLFFNKSPLVFIRNVSVGVSYCTTPSYATGWTFMIHLWWFEFGITTLRGPK